MTAARARGLVASPFRYAGGKSRLVPRLRPWLAQPGLRVLLEPFAGGASVGIAAVAEGLVERAVLVERDDDVAAFWRVALSADAHELAARVRVFQATEENVASALLAPAQDAVGRACCTLVRNRVSHGGILHPRAGRLRRGEADRGLASRWYPQTLANRILDIAALRERITFLHGDGPQALLAHAGDPSVGAFCDPPYTIGGHRAGERLYVHARVDHAGLFELAAASVGPALLTYADTPQVRQLAASHNLDVLAYRLQGTQHGISAELLIGRDLGHIRRSPRRHSLRQSDTLSRRNPSASTTTITTSMTPQQPTHPTLAPLHVTAAAKRLGVSRRTAERLMSDGSLVRCAGPDSRTYVTSASVAAAQARRPQPVRRGSAAEQLGLVLASMDKLLAALRDDRAALLQALRERDEARPSSQLFGRPLPARPPRPGTDRHRRAFSRRAAEPEYLARHWGWRCLRRGRRRARWRS